jgi:multicomponent Na+:H+ antiporter subunit C
MISYQLFSLTGFVLFAAGIHGVIEQAHLVRKIMAINIMGGGVFLFLIATAWRDGPARPDPVPHAMVLTGIVVAVGATAFALALVRRLDRDTGRVSLDEQPVEGTRDGER